MDPLTEIEEITADALYAEMQRGSPVFILDVRNEDEFAGWQIESAHPLPTVNIPYFAFLEDEEASMVRVPRDRQVTVVCAKGGSSAFIAAMLAQHGIHARNLRGGMIAWGDLHIATPVPSDAPEQLGVIQLNRIGKRCLSYLIVSDGRALVVDPARHLDWYTALAQRYQAPITRVIDTHLHADHLSGGPGLARALGIPYHIRLDDAADARFPHEPLEDGTRIALGTSIVEVIALHTPGHTPGSTSVLIDGRYLLTGDTLFVNHVGRPDLGAKAEEWARLLYRTLFERVGALPDDVLILPAHYTNPAEMRADSVVGITLGEARAHNPVFQLPTEHAFLTYVLEHLSPQPPTYQEIRRANLGQVLLDEEHAIEAELGPNQCAAARPSHV
jgi:glyoxylase-like metal-dependent hydrolase (beta-lactamase superfamily II)/rhodanese-related sulfurtransferase